MSKLGISVILPAYNEEKNLKGVVKDALNFLKTIKDSWEIIIVDDGSTDKTGKIAEGLSRINPRIRFVQHGENLGYGRSLSDGFSAGRYSFVFFTDADRQFKLEALAVMWPLAKTGVVDLIIGYRIKRKDPFLRKVLSWGYNSLAGFLFDLQVKDIDCAFKIFKKEIFKKIKIESNNFFVNTEILAKARFFKFKILEISVPHFPRKAGKSSVSLKYIPLTLKELIRIRRSIGRFRNNENPFCQTSNALK